MNNCLLQAFSMATGLSAEQLISEIGHDGQAILYPDLEEPLCRRAFHAQEIIVAALRHNICIVTIQKEPMLFVDPEHFITIPTDIDSLIFSHNGVIAGLTKTGKPHAIAKISNQYFDPRGYIMMESNIDCEYFYMVK